MLRTNKTGARVWMSLVTGFTLGAANLIARGQTSLCVRGGSIVIESRFFVPPQGDDSLVRVWIGSGRTVEKEIQRTL